VRCADPLRAQAVGRAVALARRLRRRLTSAALAVRAWAVVHALRARRLEVDRAAVAPDGEVVIAVDVVNAGDREGDEVVQLYVRDVRRVSRGR
jgi:hypothetical protein